MYFNHCAPWDEIGIMAGYLKGMTLWWACGVGLTTHCV